MIATCIQEIRIARVVFSHLVRRTDAVTPTLGLWQGCLSSLMVCRWVLEDIVCGLSASWTERGFGPNVNVNTLDVSLLG